MKHPRTRKQGRRSSDSVLAEIREDERTHISRELHDDLGQLLATLRVELTLLKQVPPGSPQAWALMESMDALLLNAIGSLRRIAGNLRPRALDEGGLCFALDALRREFEKRHGIRCLLETPHEELVLDEHYSTAIYRLVQESLTNIARHAGASTARIRLRSANGELSLEIADDGRGIEAAGAAKTGALGLLGMRERVASMRGRMIVSDCATGADIASGERAESSLSTAQRGNGTRIAICIPLPPSSGAAGEADAG